MAASPTSIKRGKAGFQVTKGFATAGPSERLEGLKDVGGIELQAWCCPSPCYLADTTRLSRVPYPQIRQCNRPTHVWQQPPSSSVPGSLPGTRRPAGQRKAVYLARRDLQATKASPSRDPPPEIDLFPSSWRGQPSTRNRGPPNGDRPNRSDESERRSQSTREERGATLPRTKRPRPRDKTAGSPPEGTWPGLPPASAIGLGLGGGGKKVSLRAAFLSALTRRRVAIGRRELGAGKGQASRGDRELGVGGREGEGAGELCPHGGGSWGGRRRRGARRQTDSRVGGEVRCGAYSEDSSNP